MSRQTSLPPRCPLQKKTTIRPANGSVSRQSCKDIELHTGECGHHKSISQSSILEEQPAWLDDLLSDTSNSNSTGILHRRAASDSLTLFDGLVPLPGLDQLNEIETPDPFAPLELSCMYGPNSPRRKNKFGFPKNETVSAFSEYVMENGLQHFDGDVSASGFPLLDSFGNACASAGEIYTETIPMKRYPGQRSRIRKLQYIAELEKTVDILQNLGSELVVSVAPLLQQHVALSMENNTLKQQLLRVQQEKFIVDGEYQSLKKEVERLTTGLTSHSNRKLHSQSRSAANLPCPETIWKMIDMGKLDLN